MPRYNGTTMPRPKKNKVTVVEQAFEMDSCAGFGEHPVAAPIKTVEKLPTPPSPGKPLRLEAGRELKAAGKTLKWALKQQSAAEETYRCERAIYRAKCVQLEKKNMTGTAAQRMSAAYDLLDAVSKADRRYLLVAVDVHEAQIEAQLVLELRCCCRQDWRTIKQSSFIQSKAA